MILTIRTWHVERLNYAEFARISEEEFWPAFEGFEGRALAVWAIRAGGPERMLVMTRYESIDHWLGTRAWGPAADKLKTLSEKRDRMILDTDMIALKPVSRRQPQSDAPESTAGVYIREQFRVEPERIERFRELTEDVWLPRAEQHGGVRLIGIWRSYIGPQNTVHTLTRADDIGTWEKCRAQNDGAGKALQERAGLCEALSVQLLYPLTRRRP
ncbi:MAG: NIPSNAP family protein [Pseudomonadota bacterium]